jgi:hypothetical protein
MTLHSPFIRRRSLRASARITPDFVRLLFFFGVILVFENILVFLWAWNIAGEATAHYNGVGVYTIAMLCSAAASFIGGLIGFLFGVPESTTMERSTTTIDAAHRHPAGDSAQANAAVTAVERRASDRVSGLRRNTNLESISDTLTKGILAIGASQLYNLSQWGAKAAGYLGPSFGPDNAGQIVALCVLIYGGLAGFLFGYLATRIFLTGAFERNDPRDADDALGE